MPLIAEVKRRGLTCTVITNGGRLEALARELVELGIDSIAVSIDGPPEVHDRIRGRVRQLREGRSGDPRRRALAEEAGRARFPWSMAILPVTELNLEAIGAAVEALRPLPLDTINVGLRWFIPTERGRRVRTGDAGRLRRDGDVLEGVRVRLGIGLRDRGKRR